MLIRVVHFSKIIISHRPNLTQRTLDPPNWKKTMGGSIGPTKLRLGTFKVYVLELCTVRALKSIVFTTYLVKNFEFF